MASPVPTEGSVRSGIFRHHLAEDSQARATYSIVWARTHSPARLSGGIGQSNSLSWSRESHLLQRRDLLLPKNVPWKCFKTTFRCVWRLLKHYSKTTRFFFAGSTSKYPIEFVQDAFHWQSRECEYCLIGKLKSY